MLLNIKLRVGIKFRVDTKEDNESCIIPISHFVLKMFYSIL